MRSLASFARLRNLPIITPAATAAAPNAIMGPGLRSILNLPNRPRSPLPPAPPITDAMLPNALIAPPVALAAPPNINMTGPAAAANATKAIVTVLSGPGSPSNACAAALTKLASFSTMGTIMGISTSPTSIKAIFISAID